MAEITLVRHGQANTGARNEADYDRLSDLGHRQAAWLAEYFLNIERGYDAILHGSLARQRDTAAPIAKALGLTPRQDPRLNELSYFSLASQLEARRAIPVPLGREAFLSHVPIVLSAWRAGEIHSDQETIGEFETRVLGVLEDAISVGGRVMLVTSGGVISMMLRHILGLDDGAHAKILLQIYNGSYHRIRKEGDAVMLEIFNAVPHLEGPERLGAKSHI